MGQLIALSICVSVASGVSRVELHVHLDGATSFETLYDIAVHRNLTLPTGVNSKASLQAYCGTFATTGFGFFDCVLDFLGGFHWQRNDLWRSKHRTIFHTQRLGMLLKLWQPHPNTVYPLHTIALFDTERGCATGDTITPAQAIDAVIRTPPLSLPSSRSTSLSLSVTHFPPTVACAMLTVTCCYADC